MLPVEGLSPFLREVSIDGGILWHCLFISSPSWVLNGYNHICNVCHLGQYKA